jgi:hypothetical protein
MFDLDKWLEGPVPALGNRTFEQAIREPGNEALISRVLDRLTELSGTRELIPNPDARVGFRSSVTHANGSNRVLEEVARIRVGCAPVPGGVSFRMGGRTMAAGGSESLGSLWSSLVRVVDECRRSGGSRFAMWDRVSVSEWASQDLVFRERRAANGRLQVELTVTSQVETRYGVAWADAFYREIHRAANEVYAALHNGCPPTSEDLEALARLQSWNLPPTMT